MKINILEIQQHRPNVLYASTYSLTPLTQDEVDAWFKFIEELFAVQAWQAGLYPSLEASRQDAHEQFETFTCPLHQNEGFERWKKSKWAFYVVLDGQKIGHFWYGLETCSKVNLLSESAEKNKFLLKRLKSNPLIGAEV